MDTPSPSTVTKLEQLATDYQQLTLLIKQQKGNYQFSEEQQTLLKHAKAILTPYLKAKKQGLITTETGPPQEEEVEINSFISACTQWRKTMKTFLNQTARDYAEVTINIKPFRSDLAENQSPLPITQDLYKEWVTVVDELAAKGDTTTGAILFAALRDHQGAAWTLTNDMEGLKQHYKKNRRAYKQTGETGESFTNTHLPKQQALLDALAMSASEEDPNLPKNQKEANAKAERGRERMQERWSNWQIATREKIIELDTTTEDAIIEPQLLIQNRSKKIESPAHAATSVNNLCAAIEKAIAGATPPISYEKASQLASEQIQRWYKDTVNETFIQQAVEAADDDVPIGFREWLKSAIDEHSVAKKNFATAIRNWTKEAANAVAICENQLQGRDFKLDGKKLANNLQKEFSKTANNDAPAAAMGQQLIQALPQQPTVPFYTVDAVWTSALNQLQTDATIQQLWEQYMAPHLATQSPEQTQTALLNSLPKAEGLGNALYDARFKAPKTNTPTQKHPLCAAFKGERINGEQSFHFFVHVPLVYEKAPNHNGKTWQHALPSAKSQDYYLEVHNSVGYEIDKSSLKVERHSTNYDVKDGFFAATTGVTFYLNIKDTLERRVVVPGGSGAYNVITLDTGEAAQLIKKIGFHTDALKNGVQIDLIGKGQASAGSVETTVSIFGRSVIAHYYPDKSWPNNIQLESQDLLDERKDQLANTYGSQSYDIKFYAEIHSVRNESTQQKVSVINGRSGTVNLDEDAQIEGRSDLIVTFIKDQLDKVILEND